MTKTNRQAHDSNSKLASYSVHLPILLLFVLWWVETSVKVHVSVLALLLGVLDY